MARPRKNGDTVNGKRKRRGNGAGSLMRKGNVYYALFMVLGDDGVRRRVCRTTGTGDLEAAREKLNQFAAEYETKNAIARDVEQRQRFTVKLMQAQAVVEADAKRIDDERKAALAALPALRIEDAFGEYCKSANRPDSGEATLANYGQQFGVLARWLGENFPQVQELRQIGRTEAEAFAQHLRDTRSAGTFNAYVTFFRCMWRVLADGDEGRKDMPAEGEKPKAKLTGNPWEKIQKREAVQHIRRELTVEEVAKVIGTLDGEMKLLFELGVYTGMRLGDCCQLNWGEVDMVRGFITTIPRKTKRHAHGKHTVIPIPPPLAEQLAKIPANKRSGYVLPECAAIYQHDRAGMTDRIQRRFKAAGIETTAKAEGESRSHVVVGFHSLRHTYVSLSANAGVPLALVQSIVGHSNPAMTRHYLHESKDALKNAAAALPDVIDIEATVTPASGDGADDTTEGRLADFRKLVQDMTADERKAAAKWLADFNESH